MDVVETGGSATLDRDAELLDAIDRIAAGEGSFANLMAKLPFTLHTSCGRMIGSCTPSVCGPAGGWHSCACKS
ncbi:hypothetical protein [Saccharopolyspora spinosa]|uniref:hypothetical protein n=1 Tax=Saccharopolyspora spinosa TaxID=60894 RepID=UPI0011798A39|nr:hypothetical protein [Saccharopolyspora spinosa]